MLITGSIVIYNNHKEILSEAIKSILSYSQVHKLYLIDNSPSDTLQKYFLSSKIQYIHNPSNPGFGAAHNIAIRLAIKDGSTYHLILNPDIYFGSNVLKELTNYMERNKNIGNIMPKVLYPDGSLQYLCKLLPTPYDWIGRRFNPLKKMTNKRNRKFELRFTGYNGIMDVPYLSGCFMYLRVSTLKKIGFFDENIFMYGEETDLCRRLIDGGYRVVFYPYVSIYHYFEKGSHKSWHLTKIGIQSAIYYFNKWGWLFDKKRREINRETLTKLNYYE